MYTVRHVLRHVVVSFTTLAQISRLFEKIQTHIDKRKKRKLKLMLKRFFCQANFSNFTDITTNRIVMGLQENTAFQYTVLIVN